VPTYFTYRWLHNLADEPVVLFEELDDQRYETRKVHQYADGRLVRTDQISDLSTSLSWVPVPPEDEIASQPEFDVMRLSAEEFEDVWRRATDAI